MEKTLITLALFIPFLIFSQEKSLKDTNQELNLKVVFHIVHKNVDGKQVKIKNRLYDKTALEYLVKKLNEGYNKVDTTKIEKEFRKLVANCKINFELPTKDENYKPIEAVSFHKITKNHFIPFVSDYLLKTKKNGLLNQEKYINIWFCELDEVSNFYDLGGYALSETAYKGVVLNINSINDGSAVWLINHEIGHYLGLSHIWGNVGNSCYFDDGISDTPKQKKAHKSTDIPNNIQKECGNSNKTTNYQNFMDYSYNVGMFTLGQKNKMRETILDKKFELLQYNNQIITTNLKLKKMDKFSFNYYTLSTNNLNFKTNTKYLNEFIKYYKEIKPTSEFHLKRLREELKTELQNKVNSFDYSKKYKSDYNIGIGKYDFTNNYFPFRTQKRLYEYGYYTLLDEFKIIGKGYGGLTYGYFNLYAVNYKDFDKISLSSAEAEMFLNKLNRRRLYVTVEYSLLKLPLVEHQKIVSMLGYIEKIYLFSDKERTKLVHTIKSKTTKSYYNKYKYAIITGSTMSSNINYKFY